MSFEIYILSISHQSRTLTKFKESICALCFQESDENGYIFFIQSGVLSFLVSKAYPVLHLPNAGGQILEICVSVVRNLLQGIFSLVEQDVVEERLNPFCALWHCGILERYSLNGFCSFALSLYLEQQPHATVLHAFLIQENCRTGAMPFHLQILIDKITSTLELEEVELLISTSMKKEETNWKSFIVIVDSFIRTHNQAFAITSKLTAELIKEGFEHLNETILQKALLIGRQMALNPDVSFDIVYRQWFQAHFAESSLVKNPEIFSFFIQVLSSLLPFERNVDCIKVTLERTMHVPPECQIMYADYVALLKTRIKDLKPQVSPVRTLEKILHMYQETGKIPPFVLEASLMQKHQFRNEFLPALLVPRVVPKVPDIKERFIEALDRVGKIPGQILQKYKIACQQEEKGLLAGINMADDNFNDFVEELR